MDSKIEIRDNVEFFNDNSKNDKLSININVPSKLTSSTNSIKKSTITDFHNNGTNNIINQASPIPQEEEDDSKADYILTMRNLHKTYLIGIEGVPALRGVSLKIKRGEFLVILGTSGGGKTTLLNLIGTIDCPTRGDLKIFDQMVRSKTHDDVLSMIRLEKIAFVFQNFNLLQNLTVLENVELPMKIKGSLSSDEITKRAIDLIERVGLSKRLKHFPNQLSGGEQQRVTIARALSNRPEILLLDEPTGDLDTRNSDIVMNILIDLNLKENITMIMVTHDISLKYFGQRVVKIIDGKINSTELIPTNVRQECIDKLKERYENIGNLGIREGAVSSNISGEQNSTTQKTFVRKVTDYAIKKLNKQTYN